MSYAFLVLCGFFMQSASCVFWTIPPVTFPLEVAGGVRGIINALGSLGGFIGPVAVGGCSATFHSYDAGIYCLAAALLVGFMLTLTLPASTAGKTQKLQEVSARFQRIAKNRIRPHQFGVAISPGARRLGNSRQSVICCGPNPVDVELLRAPGWLNQEQCRACHFVSRED